MDSDFWIKKWQEGETRFHQRTYHPQLTKYADRFPPGTILVPLCGKSLDMLFLVSKGHRVIGVELSSLACRSFFEENNLAYIEKTYSGFTLFESEFVTLWCGDFFNLPTEVWDSVTGIYDRAALVALPEDLRKKYVFEIVNRSSKYVEILLIAYEYDQEVVAGPPFSVSENEVKVLFKNFDIEKLAAVIVDDMPRFKSTSVTETVYWLN